MAEERAAAAQPADTDPAGDAGRRGVEGMGRGEGGTGRAYRLLALDLDGTVLTPKGTVSPRVRRAVRRALRAAPDGFPRVSTYTIWSVLRESGASYQRRRTWCPTGSAVRRRKAGLAIVTDPDADSKKS